MIFRSIPPMPQTASFELQELMDLYDEIGQEGDSLDDEGASWTAARLQECRPTLVHNDAVLLLGAIVGSNAVKCAEVLLKNPALKATQIPSFWLGEACFQGRNEIVALMVEAGVPIQPPLESTDLSPLHQAVRAGSLRWVQTFLAAGASSQGSAYSLTPLHLAVTHRSPEILIALLDANADVQAVDDRGLTPLALADQNMADVWMKHQRERLSASMPVNVDATRAVRNERRL